MVYISKIHVCLILLFIGTSQSFADSNSKKYERFMRVKTWKTEVTLSCHGVGTDQVDSGVRNYSFNSGAKIIAELANEEEFNKYSRTWRSPEESVVISGDYLYKETTRESGIGNQRIMTLQSFKSGKYDSMPLVINADQGEYEFVFPSVVFDDGQMTIKDGETSFSQVMPLTLAPCDLLNMQSCLDQGKRPLPPNGLQLNGSYSFLLKTAPGFYISQGIPCTLSYVASPKELDNVSLKITELKQTSGSTAGKRTNFLFKNGKLVFTVEAKIEPKEYAKEIKWEIPSLGEEANREIKIEADAKKGTSKVTVTYNKLPRLNDEFGQKKVVAKFEDMELSDQKDFKVFFERDGLDNPKAKDEGAQMINWYYYWSQGAIPKLEEFTYRHNPSSGGAYDPNSGSEGGPALIIDKAATEVIPGMNQPLTGTVSGIVDGRLDNIRVDFQLIRDRVEGIDAVAAIVAHEKMHQYLFEHATVEEDGDRVSYEDEERIIPRTHYSNANTYGLGVAIFYGDAEDYINSATSSDERNRRRAQIERHREQLGSFGDNEIKAIVAERQRNVDQSKDWGYPGSQAQ